MRATLITLCALFISFTSLACSKDAKEPETQATAPMYQAPPATTAVVVPGSETSTGNGGTKSMFAPLEVQRCDMGLQRPVEQGEKLTVRRDHKMMLCLYPVISPADAETVHVDGPFYKADRGDVVLKFDGKKALGGEKKVTIVANGAQFHFWLVVIEPPKKS